MASCEATRSSLTARFATLWCSRYSSTSGPPFGASYGGGSLSIGRSTVGRSRSG